MQYTKILNELDEKQKTWLVSGCAGFIGSNLVETLLSHNQKVVGLDNFSTGYQHNLDDIQACVTPDAWGNFSFMEGDIRDFETCMRVTQGVDIVLHQAALGSVPRSIDNPVVSNDSNVTGFLNILTAAKENGVKRFVYASSSSVYGDSEELPKVESRTGNLLSPYAVTKYVNELYAGVFRKCYGIETVGLRYFNVFGKRQDPHGAYAAVIPTWVSALLKGESVYINGDGETSRDFTYIQNVVQANILAGTTTNEKVFGEAFNTAVGGRNTLNELYGAIVEGLLTNLENFVKKEPIFRDFRAGDIRHSNANIDKMRDMIGYEPTHDISKGLEESISWYIHNLKYS
ncbi:MAG: SDR family oxidoreductase [Sulfuricurvum sp.]|jgi:UDP-N-acetylglucosamine 4-epimerase|uniref:SDR family oxidoreductase n=1 Tax=Sulfuricurvum sp. TaxID=2025608 RepID=UPI0025D14414|nr:SDR family oxidoreductase [Sulfuricurvum sp.]MCK9372243.1 SDR family oxidoreductase [Sulfuricurvum sp.]